jgi:hypothetical protein
VTREDAERTCDRLTREHPERATSRWIPREAADGEWSVVRIPLPEGMRRDPLKTAEQAKPRPPEPDDPRTSHSRNVGGEYGP